MRPMTSLFRSLVPALLVLSGTVLAQLVTREPREGMFTTTLDVSGPRQLLELPEGIPSEEGSATCHAHVPGISKGAIPIYLINRTDAKASITFIGSDTNLKACRKLNNGKWERVQPSNGWVMCADSINKLAIPPGMFVRISVACPPSGTSATLRYQVADDWISNEFSGFFDPKARDQAQRDLNSPADCPTWAHILKSPITASDAPVRGVPSKLESDLSPENRFERRAAAIDLLQQYADFTAARLACDDALAAINQLPEQTAEIASARFSLLRSRPSVATASDLEFASRCLGYLRTTPGDSYYGHPSQHPGMCWEALAWLAGNPNASPTLPWNEVFSLWKERLSTANLAELTGMAKLLESARLTNEHVPSSILISLLKSDCLALRELSVERLLERNLDEELAEVASGLDEVGRSIVIRHVAADRERFGRRFGPLNDFLIASAKANPEATFHAIDKSTAWDQTVYLEPGLSLAFGDFFVKIVSVGLDGPAWIEDYRMQDRIRRGMRYVNRVALLKKLAGSEAYSATKAESPVAERDYFVAREARRQSMRLGYEP
jgi:hypothetical protein